MLKLYLFCSVLLCFAGCSKTSIIEEEKFIEIYTDLVIAQDTSMVPGNDLTIVKKKIFDKHSITEDEYEATVSYYNENPQRWNEFFNKTIERLEHLKKLEEEKL